nr:S26 family signal peptidase [uncultured Gemmiger sp.]
MCNKLGMIKTGLFWLAFSLAVACALVGLFLPGVAEKYIPFRLYTVLTDSMSPTITPMSLVLVRQIPPDAPLELEPEQIITFRADRFGHSIIQTHRFSHTEWDEELSQIIYRTHPEQTADLDFYKTTRRDILGVYVCSVPYFGKVLLFLKSRWGLILLGEELIIFLLNQLIKARWEERSTGEKGSTPLPLPLPE